MIRRLRRGKCDMSGDRVFQFVKPPKPYEGPLRTIQTDYRECRHARFDVHPALPRVFCRDCDTDLDPFWVLRQIASAHYMREHRVEDLKRETARMEKLVQRQLEGRRSKDRAESDARHIQSLQDTQRAPASRFPGDIATNDTLPEDRRGANKSGDETLA